VPTGWVTAEGLPAAWHRAVGRGRLEAFSDGVLAIVITIMVLELRPPEGTTWESLLGLSGVFLAYVLSFVYVGIYWNNHHHLVKHVTHVTASIMWCNLGLPFWLTLFPFVTAWAASTSTHPSRRRSTACCSWRLRCPTPLQALIVRQNRRWGGPLRRALGRDRKGRISLVLYLVAVPAAWISTWVSIALYVVVAILWIVPDRRLERALAELGDDAG